MEKYNVPKFSFLNKLKSDPLENQDTYVEIYAADSLFTGNVDNIHRIGNFIYYSMLSNFNPWYFLAKWGQGSPEKVVYLVLVYSPHEGWQCKSHAGTRRCNQSHGRRRSAAATRAT